MRISAWTKTTSRRRRAAVGSRFHVDNRGEQLEAEVVRRPFYTKGSVKR